MVCSWYNRLREPLHSESGITSRTLLAGGVARLLTTSKSRDVPRAVTLPLKWGHTTGDKRRRAVKPSEPDGWGTWRRWHADSRTDSGRVQRQRNKQRRIRVWEERNWFKTRGRVCSIYLTTKAVIVEDMTSTIYTRLQYSMWWDSYPVSRHWTEDLVLN